MTEATGGPSTDLQNEDLSSGKLVVPAVTNPAIEKANEILEQDAKARRLHRHGATVAALCVITSLVWAMFIVVNTLMEHFSHITPQSVAIATVLVVAVTVLSIALVRSTFVPPAEHRADEKHKEPIVTLPGAEAAKAIRDVVDATYRGITGKRD